MTEKKSSLLDWTPEQLAIARRWVATWKLAAVDLEPIRRAELRSLDTYKSIVLLCSPGGETGTTILRPGSGLVEQQRWFMRVARNP